MAEKEKQEKQKKPVIETKSAKTSKTSAAKEPKKAAAAVTKKETSPAEAPAKKTEATAKKTEAAVKKSAVPKKRAPKKPAPQRTSKRKVRVGRVVSDKMDKTAVVAIEMTYSHPLYKKFIKKTKKFFVHDAENRASVGDIVEIMENRPLSKLKRWRLVSFVEKAK